LRSRLCSVLLGLAVLAGCASGSVDLEKLSSPSDEVVWKAGQEAVEKENWENARQYFRRVIDAFPQSRYQPDARIAYADSFLNQGGAGNAIMAVSAYREFLTLYPSAPQAAYAQFRAAEAYYQQRNKPDRDQTPTHQALDEYQRLLDVYPNSPYAEQARERIQECRQTLAKASFNVGYFYQKTRKAWRAAVYRYNDVLRNYPDYENLDEVLFRLGQALAASARYAEARPIFARLEEEYPESKWIKEAREISAEMPEMAVPMAPTTAAAGDAETTPAETPAADAGPQPDAGPPPDAAATASSDATVRPPER
jgi:outer membrane protein assembly factor BamD